MDSISIINTSTQHQMLLLIQEIQSTDSQELDLYDMLVAQPKSIKKASVIYDYKPAPVVNDDVSTDQSVKDESLQNQKAEVSVKRCTCSKTRCQKNYCECFRQGLTCSSECGCISCCNKQPLFTQTASLSQGRCNCQKSRCSKNYCECHSNGRKCGESCRCLDCDNIEKQDKFMNEKPRKMVKIDTIRQN